MSKKSKLFLISCNKRLSSPWTYPAHLSSSAESHQNENLTNKQLDTYFPWGLGYLTSGFRDQYNDSQTENSGYIFFYDNTMSLTKKESKKLPKETQIP